MYANQSVSKLFYPKTLIPWNNAFWPTVVGEADIFSSVSASAFHIGGPKGVSPGQKAVTPRYLTNE